MRIQVLFRYTSAFVCWFLFLIFLFNFDSKDRNTCFVCDDDIAEWCSSNWPNNSIVHTFMYICVCIHTQTHHLCLITNSKWSIVHRFIRRLNCIYSWINREIVAHSTNWASYTSSDCITESHFMHLYFLTRRSFSSLSFSVSHSVLSHVWVNSKLCYRFWMSVI